MSLTNNTISQDMELFMDVPTSLDAIKYDYQSKGFDYENNCTLDKIDVKEYLNTVISVYGDELLIEEQINALLQGYLKESEKYTRFEEELEKKVRSYIEQKKANLICEKEALEHKVAEESKLTEADKQTILEQEHITIPTRPSFNKCEPTAPKPFDNKSFDKTLLTEPSMPVYQKPGLFNKNKVIEENERRKAEYEHRLSLHRQTVAEYSKYQEEKKLYDEAVSKYTQAKKTYDDEYSEYENKMSQFLELKKQIQETYDLYEKKKAHAVIEKHQAEIESFDAKIGNCENLSLQDYFEYSNASKEEYEEFRLKNDFYKDEITEASKALFEVCDLKEALLALNVIYPKYKGWVALTTFHDYYESGRVTELTGPYGAYNLYESEVRSNLILEKLDTIIDRLDSIKNNQYSLYCIMNQVNDNIVKLNEALGSIDFKLAHISEVTDTIGDSKQNSRQREQRDYSIIPAFKAYYQNKEVTQTHIVGDKKKASVILRGALGGALAGPVGAIIGAMSAINKNLQYKD